MSYQEDKNVASFSGVLANIGREKPHNDDAESSVLGAMLLDIDALEVGAVALHNVPNAFYRPANQMIFDAIVALKSQYNSVVPDYVVLADYLKKAGQLEAIGGPTYLAQLANCVPTAKNIEAYVECVKQNAILRSIIEACSNGIITSYEATDDPKLIVDSVEKAIFEITQMNEKKDYRTIDVLLKEVGAMIGQMIKGDSDIGGIKTGYSQIDDMIVGLKPGDLFVLAARPSVGKTALALNIAANIALRGRLDKEQPENEEKDEKQRGIGVGIFSLEMSSQQLVMRLMQSESRVNLRVLQRTAGCSTKDINKLKEAGNRLQRANIVIDDTGGINILELRAKARRMCSHNKVECIVIDYLQLISVDSGKNANRENDVARISGSLKALAKELNIPIIVLAQLNRAAEQNKDEKPKLSNLRESGAIEQDADVVALLHRKLTKQHEMAEDDESGLEAELIVAKNRNGRTGIQKLTFIPQYTLYEEASEVSDADVPTIAQ